MTDEDPPVFEEPSPSRRAPRRDPPAWVGGLALFAALAVFVSPFLDWLVLAPEQAERHGEALQAAARAEAPGPRSDSWAELGARLAGRHAITGLDLVAWSRAARERIQSTSADAADRTSTSAVLVRGWWSLSLLLLGMAGGALLLAVYLLMHRLVRFRSPLLVLSATVGAVALTFAGGVDWLCRPVAQAVRPGLGHAALLGGGIGLLASMIAGLRAHTVLRVLGGTVVTLLGLAGLVWMWVVHGVAA